MKTMMMIKMELEMIKKNMLAKHLQFSQKQRKHFLFIERDETRKNVYSQTSRQQVPPSSNTPLLSPHFSLPHYPLLSTQRCVPPLPRLSVALPPAALFEFD